MYMPLSTVQGSKSSEQCDRHNEGQYHQSDGQRREAGLSRRKIRLVHIQFCGLIVNHQLHTFI